MNSHFKVGQRVEVLTFGLSSAWNGAQFAGHKPATAISNELFYFSGKAGCLVVKAADIPARVRAIS